MTQLSRRANSRSWAAIAVIVFGWAVWLIQKHVLPPTPPYSLEEYALFYVAVIQLRFLLFIFSAFALYIVRGSFCVWLLMGFNLAAICLNVFYIDPENYATLNPWRTEYFAPAYRIAETLIIIWTGWHVRTDVYNYIKRFCRGLSLVAVRGGVHVKDFQK